MELETNHAPETLGALLDNNLGAVLVGVIVSAALFGILTTQCHYYALRFKQDPTWLKCMVTALWIIDGMHQIAVSVVIVQYCVHHYGDIEYVLQIPWSVSPLLGFIVQIKRLEFIVFDLCSLSYLSSVEPPWDTWTHAVNRKLWPVAAFTTTLSIIGFALGEGKAACAVLSFIYSPAEYKDLTWLVTLSLVTSSVCDIAVAIPVAWTLYTSRTEFKQTNALLTRLILWTVTSGALPAFFALLQAVMFIVKFESLIHLAANIVLAKLYGLNRRGTLTKGQQGALHFSDNIALSHMGLRRNHGHLPASKKDGLRRIQITVTTH
ncbi:hypothetical protein BS47DRAFT_1363417 [Hydnum rufescens UP504]|uniref:DUF6534 domain-containing protein n=1 Tax=Hydnum rufescens UP504 TaxID=1448309 RepID=A0A9P6DSC8_9AGAM|nr:hypothetical protein BS47DRAFT_1363417 [Hydnum rufescens UP504]